MLISVYVFRRIKDVSLTQSKFSKLARGLANVSGSFLSVVNLFVSVINLKCQIGSRESETLTFTCQF